MPKNSFRLLVIWIMVVGMSHSAFGQAAVVDDPSTPERRRMILELTYISGQTPGSETQYMPNAFFRYGIRDNFEVNLSTSVLSMRNAGSKRIIGQDDTVIGAKWRLLEETASLPQVAVCFSTKFPSASRSRGMGTGEFDHSAWMTWAKSFGKAQLYGHLGGSLLGEGSWGMKDNWFCGVALGYQLTETLVVGGELYGYSRSWVGGRDDLSWGVGFTYNFHPDRALMFQVGKSTHGNSDLNIYSGVSLTFK